MYNPKSLKAEEFIDHDEIMESIKYADENIKNNISVNFDDNDIRLRGQEHLSRPDVIACQGVGFER